LGTVSVFIAGFQLLYLHNDLSIKHSGSIIHSQNFLCKIQDQEIWLYKWLLSCM